MQNISPLEQVFNKGKEKNIVGLNEFCDHSRLFCITYFQVTNINPYWLQLHVLAAGSLTDSHFQEHLF